MSPTEPSMAELGWRMGEVERRMEQLAKQLNEGIAALGNQIGTLGFVRGDVYTSEKNAAIERHKALDEKIEATHKLAMWAVALVVTTTIGAIITAILGVSGVFR